MARKKAAEDVVFPSVFTVKEDIAPLSIDTGREDLNTIVTKLNEVIDFLNYGKENKENAPE